MGDKPKVALADVGLYTVCMHGRVNRVGRILEKIWKISADLFDCLNCCDTLYTIDMLSFPLFEYHSVPIVYSATLNNALVCSAHVHSQ